MQKKDKLDVNFSKNMSPATQLTLFLCKIKGSNCCCNKPICNQQREVQVGFVLIIHGI